MTTKTRRPPRVAAPSQKCRCFCGALLINTRGGYAVCSDDIEHGGLIPAVPKSEIDHAWFWNWAKELPDANKEVPATSRFIRYEIDGRGGYVKSHPPRPVTRKPARLRGYVYAFDGDSVFRFEHPED